jgi:hypothetical protein
LADEQVIPNPRLNQIGNKNKRNTIMTKTFKLVYCGLVAGAVALFAVIQSAQANTITGGISFNGNVTPYLNNTGTGTQASDYVSAHSVVFGPTVVSLGANGSFAGISAGTTVNMYAGALEINPPALPFPVTSPLWSVGGFTFTLSGLIESAVQPTFMALSGTGIMSDGIPADFNTGTWVATFTTEGSTFSWNSSSGATGTSVPDGGSSLLLLGLGLTALTAFVKFSKQAVA